MVDSILIKANKYIKNSRPYLPEDTICDTFRNNSFMELAFMSKRCPNDACGACIMCDYGVLQGEKSASVYIAEMNKILDKEKGIEYLLICTNGSILNPNQISEETLYKILKAAANTDIPHIIIEAHYNDISEQKLANIKQIMPDKNLTLELGLETVSQYYQDTLIMKHINIANFDKTISMIQNYKFNVDINILLGLPFLSAKEQFDETLKTVEWTLERGCNPVIFPVNIKPYTLLMHMYKNSFYTPVSHWLLILLLDAVEAEQLSKITIAYYGNRTEDYYDMAEQPIFPGCCEVCQAPIEIFYAEFCKEENSIKRKNLLQNILAFKQCDCLSDLKNQINQTAKSNFHERYASYTRFLHKEFDAHI
jgi:radical SAM enzyme (TIGR01210 family)